jgi:hypothetical protein
LIREKSKARIRGIVTKWQVGNVKEKQKAGSTSLLNIIAIIPWAPSEYLGELTAGDVGISVAKPVRREIEDPGGREPDPGRVK